MALSTVCQECGSHGINEMLFVVQLKCDFLHIPFHVFAYFVCVFVRTLGRHHGNIGFCHKTRPYTFSGT